MTFDHVMFVLEIILLFRIFWQGEIIVKCERGVYRLQKEREGERAKWREAKRQQVLKRESAPKINDSNPSTESPLPDKTNSVSTKTTNAKSV